MARQPRIFPTQGVAADLPDRAAVLAYKGPRGEIINDGEGLRLQDGSTPGGIPLLPPAKLVDPANPVGAALIAAQAGAGAVARPANRKVLDRLDAFDFIPGALHASILDRTITEDIGPYLLKAIQAAEAAGGRELHLRAGVYPTAIPLFNGDGSATAASSKPGVRLVGDTHCFYRSEGVVIRAIAAMPILYEIRGPLDGAGWSRIRFDCNGLAVRGVRLNGVSDGEFSNFSIVAFLMSGFEMLGRGPAGGTGWCAGNDVRNFVITAALAQDGARGLRLSGDIGKVLDPHRNTFINGIVQINRGQNAPNYAAEYGFCDSNTFLEVDYTVYASGQGAALLRTTADSGSFPYPQHNKHFGCSIPTIVTTGSVGTDEFYAHCTADGEAIPNDPTIIGCTDKGETFNDLAVRKSAPALLLKAPNGQRQLRLQSNASDTAYSGTSLARTADGVSFTSLLGFDANDLINALKGFATDLSVRKSTATVKLGTAAGNSFYRILHNANDSVNYGLIVQLSTDDVSWTTVLSFNPDGTIAMFMAGVGLRTLQAGAAGSAATGKRMVMVDN